MKLLYLSYFRAVAQVQSVSKAAELLHVSQPTITYAIKELESEFNIKLFIRKRYGLCLTKEGSLFLDVCTELLDHANAAETRMHAIARKNHEITIGIPPMMSITFFPHFKRFICEKVPDISIRRYEAGANAICANLSQGYLDAGIVPKQFVNTSFFYCLDLKEQRYVCCVGKDHRLAGKESVSIEDLKDEPFVVLPQEYANYTFTFKVFEEHGLTPNTPLVTTQFASVIDHVEQEGFVSFVFQSYAMRYRDRVVAIPLDMDPAQTNQMISLIVPKREKQSEAVDRVLTALQSLDPREFIYDASLEAVPGVSV